MQICQRWLAQIPLSENPRKGCTEGLEDCSWYGSVLVQKSTDADLNEEEGSVQRELG